MVERLVVFTLLILLLGGGFVTFRRWQLRRVAHIAASDPVLCGLVPGIPAIVYFTSPVCTPCRTRQKPALLALQSDFGGRVQIIEVNALDQPETASRWGVWSVPTTFVLDGSGRPRDVNYGVAGTEKLKQQLRQVA
jgi:thiol-disulfide isomerase/thioredoxin